MIFFEIGRYFNKLKEYLYWVIRADYCGSTATVLRQNQRQYPGSTPTVILQRVIHILLHRFLWFVIQSDSPIFRDPPCYAI